MRLIEHKYCNLLPQLGKMETKVGDIISKKGSLSHFIKKNKRKKFRVEGTECRNKSKNKW